MTAQARIDTDERRRRLVTRHHLGRTAHDAATVATALVGVHSSDPITPHLAMRARVTEFRVADLDSALYEERSLLRLHAMRRTLFVVPTASAGVLDAACGEKVARAERRKVEGWVAQARGSQDPAWLADVEARLLTTLADGVPQRTQALTAAVPGLDLRIQLGSGRWVTDAPLSSRLLFVLALEGKIVRAHPAGSWVSSQYHWAVTTTWTSGGASGTDLDPAAARARLASDWLTAHGPATTVDLRWWTAWTAREAQEALRDIDAAPVDLEGGGAGWVLPDDVDLTEDRGPSVAFLPGLDPTTMGWKERDWYLGTHADALFDRNGNAGPTIWLDGRVVGGWAQQRDGRVVSRLLEDVGAEAAKCVAVESAALTAWFDGLAVTPRFRTPLERELSG